MKRITIRRNILPYAIAAIFAVGALLNPAGAHASGARKAAPVSTHPLAKVIEWNHPIAISSLVKQHAGQIAAIGIQPNAGSGVQSVCSNGYAYPITYGGQDYWQTTWYNLVVYVEYLYCPGGAYGYNFSYGVAYTNSSDTYVVRYGANWSYTWDGASLHSPNGTYISDGYPYQGPYVSNGYPTSDYSNAGPGNLTWSAQMWVDAYDETNGQSATVHVSSPTF